MHDFVVFHCSKDYCVELIIVDDNSGKNCSHLTKLTHLKIRTCFKINFYVQTEKLKKKEHRIQKTSFTLSQNQIK